MPIDEDVILQTQEDIAVKLNANTREHRSLRNLLHEVNSIKQRTVSDATPEDPRKTKQVMPIDESLGKDMVLTRRQEIYDKIMADKTALGI